MGRGQMSRIIRQSQRKDKVHCGRCGSRKKGSSHLMKYNGVCYVLMFNDAGLPEWIHKSTYYSGLTAHHNILGFAKEEVNLVRDIKLRNEIIREYYKTNKI